MTAQHAYQVGDTLLWRNAHGAPTEVTVIDLAGHSISDEAPWYWVFTGSTRTQLPEYALDLIESHVPRSLTARDAGGLIEVLSGDRVVAELSTLNALILLRDLAGLTHTKTWTWVA